MLKLKIPPLLLIIIFAFAQWLTSLYFTSANVSHAYLLVGAVLLTLLGSFIALLGVWSFKRAKTTVNPMSPNKSTSLVNTGIYKVTRNPMYLGMLCWLIALCLYLANYVALIWCPLFVWYMNEFQIKPEEEMLVTLFGDEFVNYCQQVRRWL